MKPEIILANAQYQVTTPKCATIRLSSHLNQSKSQIPVTLTKTILNSKQIICREPKDNQKVIATTFTTVIDSTKKFCKKFTGIALIKSLKNKRLKQLHYSLQV